MLGGGVAYVPILACDEEGGKKADWRRGIIGRIQAPFSYGTFFPDKQVYNFFSDLKFKGTVSKISSELPFVEWNVRFTTILCKPLLDHRIW